MSLDRSRSNSRVTRHLLRAATALVAVGAVLGACKTQPGDTGSAAAPVVVGPPGESVYIQSCARCHGTYREGDGTSPALDAVRMASLGEDPLRFTIAYGKGQMPGFGGLAPDQVEELIAYLRSA
ncbi:MAG: cytochrome c [Ilumatobacteraceae bacterium]